MTLAMLADLSVLSAFAVARLMPKENGSEADVSLCRFQSEGF